MTSTSYVRSTKGEILISEEDLELVSGGNGWAIERNCKTSYAYRRDRIGGRQKRVAMHRLIMDAQPGQIVDHINGNGLDNRRSNLRIVTPAQNAQNRRSQSRSSSHFLGVSFNRKARKWQVHIGRGDTAKYLGLFLDEEEAARTYDREARARYGIYAKCNFPETLP